MSKIIKIITAGPETSIQGNERLGYLNQGVQASGPMDEFSHHMANKLVGNSMEAPAIEFAIMGGQMEFLDDAIFAITGAEFTPKLNGQPIEMWKTYRAKQGDMLDIGFAMKSLRGYLAISGGFKADVHLGSTSTQAMCFLGGYHGKNLEANDILEDMNPFLSDYESDIGKKIPNGFELYGGASKEMLIMKGPHYDLYEEESVQQLCQVEWKTQFNSNRRGVRFKGIELKYKPREKDPRESPGLGNILDDVSVMGCMETPLGQEIIILGKEQNTCGAYTQIGVVITACFDVLGQCKPQEMVRFRYVDREEAIEYKKKRLALYKDETIFTYE